MKDIRNGLAGGIRPPGLGAPPGPETGAPPRHDNNDDKNDDNNDDNNDDINNKINNVQNATDNHINLIKYQNAAINEF